MRDYHEEAALLHALGGGAAALRPPRHVQRQDVRRAAPRRALPAEPRAASRSPRRPHLDLLHPARRLWKARLESCRLQSLEAALMGLRRRGRHPRRGDPAGLLRLGEAARRADAGAGVRAQPAGHRLAGRARRPRLPVGGGGPRRGPARRLQPRPRAGAGAALRPQRGRVPPGPRPRPRGAARPRPPAPRLARQAGGGARAGRGALGRRRGRRARWRAGASWPCTTSTGRGTSTRRSPPSSAGWRLVEPQRQRDVRAVAPRGGLRAAAAAAPAEEGPAGRREPSRRSRAAGTRRGPGSAPAS